MCVSINLKILNFTFLLPDWKKGSGLKYQFNQTYQRRKKLLEGGLHVIKETGIFDKAAYAYLEVMRDNDFQNAWQQLSKSAHLESYQTQYLY